MENKENEIPYKPKIKIKNSLTKYAIYSFLNKNEQSYKTQYINYCLQIKEIINIPDESKIIRLELSDGDYSCDKFFLQIDRIKHKLKKFDLIEVQKFKFKKPSEICIMGLEFLEDKNQLISDSGDIKNINENFVDENDEKEDNDDINYNMNHQKKILNIIQNLEILFKFDFHNNNIIKNLSENSSFQNNNIELSLSTSIKKSTPNSNFQSQSNSNSSKNNLNNKLPVKKFYRDFDTIISLDYCFNLYIRIIELYIVSPYVTHAIIKDSNGKYGLLHLTEPFLHEFEINKLYSISNGEVVTHTSKNYYNIGYQITVTIKCKPITINTLVNKIISERELSKLEELIPSELEKNLITLDMIEDFYIKNEFLIDIILYVINVEKVAIDKLEYYHLIVTDMSFYLIDIYYRVDFLIFIDTFEIHKIYLFKKLLIKFDDEKKLYTLNWIIPSSVFKSSVMDLDSSIDKIKIFFTENKIYKEIIQTHASVYNSHNNLQYKSIKDLKTYINNKIMKFNDLGVFLIKAKIINFKYESSYVYNSCFVCKSAVIEVNAKYLYKCEKCNDFRTGINYSYKLKICVTDEEGENVENKKYSYINSNNIMYFTLFDDLATKLLKINPEEYLKLEYKKFAQPKFVSEINTKECYFLIRIIIPENFLEDFYLVYAIEIV